MRSSVSKRIAVLLLAAMVGAPLAACSDDGVAPRPPVEGLVIQQNNVVVAEVTADGVAGGLLTAEVDELSDVYFIVFTDGEGLPLETTDDEFVILRGHDETIVTVRQVTPGSEGFQLTGVQGGQTSLIVELARGDVSDPASATSVYVTPDPVPVGVTGTV